MSLVECRTGEDVRNQAFITARRIQEQRRKLRCIAAQKSKETLKAELIAIAMRGPAPFADPVAPCRVLIRTVQIMVSEFYGIALGDMLGPRRWRRFVRPRQIAMYLCARVLHRSLPEIGRRFDRDHTSILSNVRRISVLREKDEKISAQIIEFERRLAE